MTGPILIMAGGTGGHVFPALAVARELRGRNEEVVWLGTPRGLENKLVPQEGIPLEQTRVAGLRGKGIVSWLLAPIKLTVALYDALRVVRRRNPKLVLATTTTQQSATLRPSSSSGIPVTTTGYRAR